MLTRRSALLLPLLATACAAPEPPRSFAPLRYDYLTPITLNVGVIDIDDHWQPISPADLSSLSPVRPKDALIALAQDRLRVGGSTGKAVYTIDDASLVQNGDSVLGSLAVHLDVYDADNARAAYAEARVARTRTGLGPRSALAGLLYDFTKQMMDAMNVEFEYQVRRSLQAWLVSAPKAEPAVGPVEQQPLAPP